MEVRKVFKLELHLGGYRQLLLDVFKESETIASITYNIMKHYGRRLISKGRLGKYAPKEIRHLVKEAYESKRKLDVYSEFIELQINKVWESFVGTWKAWRKMPSSDIIESLSRVVRVRVSKGEYRRMLTIEGSGCERTVVLRLVKGREVRAIIYFPPELDSVELGDPAELILYNDDRVFLHLPVKKTVELPKSVERVVGIDLGFSKYFLVAIAYDMRRNVILDVLKIRPNELKHIWKLYDEIMKRRTRIRPKGGETKSKYLKYYHRLFNKSLRLVRDGKIEYSEIPSLVPVIRWRKPKRGNKSRLKNVQIIPRDELGRSLWKIETRDFIYYCVNRLVAFAQRNHCQLIIHENLQGLKRRVKRLKQESRRLGILYQKTRDSKYLKEKRIIRNILRQLSLFPYGKFFEDLKNEGNWNGLYVYPINPYYTSITCPMCGYRSPKNRISRDRFECQSCGYGEEADYVGAVNVAKSYGRILKEKFFFKEN